MFLAKKLKMNFILKTIGTFLFACFSIVNLYSQTETVDKTDKKNTVGVHVLRSGVGRFHPGNLDRGIRGKTLGVGIDYSRNFTERWSVRSGIEQSVVNVGLDFDFLYTSMPIQIKHNFKRLTFIYFGPSLETARFRNKEIDMRYTMGYGIGWRLGFGLEHSFKNDITISLNHYLGWNGLKYDTDINYTQSGFNLGMGYKF